MRIGGGVGFYADFGSYRAREIPQVSVEDVKNQVQQSEIQGSPTSESTASKENMVQEAAKAPKTVDLENISISFNKSDDYGYIGRDSSLVGLDIEKAISDMKKDSVLEEYQYFVGTAGMSGKMQIGEDGIVIPKLAI